MTRRAFGRLSQHEQDGDKPSLEAVLDLYGVEYTYRTTQMVRCPIHGDERTPSCSINLDKQLWNCHSCGAGGDSWELIKLKEGVDFDGARTVAADHGLATSRASGSGEVLRGRYDRRGGSISARKGSDSGNGRYIPAWRRRG